jgi:hypothetical protein
MNHPVETLMKRSIAVAQEYGKLHHQLRQRQRTDRNDPLREDLERQIQAVTAEMRALCGGFVELGLKAKGNRTASLLLFSCEPRN